jgi:hypothetical protein
MKYMGAIENEKLAKCKSRFTTINDEVAKSLIEL